MVAANSFDTKKTINIHGTNYDYVSLKDAGAKLGIDIARMPKSMKIVLENVLRHEGENGVSADDVNAVANWMSHKGREANEIALTTERVLMQDLTGGPLIADIAAMRDAMVSMGKDPSVIDSRIPANLVIDHSVIVDEAGTSTALDTNVGKEFNRNGQRYQFFKWAAQAMGTLKVVPPGKAICHQANVESLATVVACKKETDGSFTLCPDTCNGTDSHTVMEGGIGVLGWGVGGIEAEAAMLGQPSPMVVPEVIGVRLDGNMPEGITAMDLVLNLTELLRKKGVTNKFVEFYGPGLDNLSAGDRLTVANMAPEYGATCGYFPIDEQTIAYLRQTSRSEEQIAIIEAYSKAQGLWRNSNEPDPDFTDVLNFDLSLLEPTISSPTHPDQKSKLSEAPAVYAKHLKEMKNRDEPISVPVEGREWALSDGDVAIAAITSCTNTSNPASMIAAALVAKKAAELGLKPKPWVKTSLTPGSQAVAQYLKDSGLQQHLDALGFQVAGFGCGTCIGNSGPLPAEITKAITDNGLITASVLSGNRNFSGRVNPDTDANFLASPKEVIFYALMGNITKDPLNDPVGARPDGTPIYYRDLQPTNAEVKAIMDQFITPALYGKTNSDLFNGTAQWDAIPVPTGATFDWDTNSDYVQKPPYFDGITAEVPARASTIEGARPLVIVGDDITTDHISPAGAIGANSPVGIHLKSKGRVVSEFTYGGLRANHGMTIMRGAFGGKYVNEMAPDGMINGKKANGVTRHVSSGDTMFVYDAAMRYQDEGTPTIVIAGKNYGKGSSRDTAAKSPALLGVKMVIAETYERIHRSNLVGMGVLPLQFPQGTDRKTFKLDGTETFDIAGLDTIKPRGTIDVTICRADGSTETIPAICRIDTATELDYYNNGGLLPFMARRMAETAPSLA